MKLRVAHAPGMPGTFSPPPRVSDSDMHHGTCVTHEAWCIPGSLSSGFLWSRRRGKHSRYSRRMRIPQFYVSGERPMSANAYWHTVSDIWPSLNHILSCCLLGTKLYTDPLLTCSQSGTREQTSVNLNQTTYFHQGNACESISQMVAILCWTQCAHIDGILLNPLLIAIFTPMGQNLYCCLLAY